MQYRKKNENHKKGVKLQIYWVATGASGSESLKKENPKSDPPTVAFVWGDFPRRFYKKRRGGTPTTEIMVALGGSLWLRYYFRRRTALRFYSTYPFIQRMNPRNCLTECVILYFTNPVLSTQNGIGHSTYDTWIMLLHAAVSPLARLCGRW